MTALPSMATEVDAGAAAADHPAAAEARKLAQLSVARSAVEIAATWLQLVAIIALCLYSELLWVTLLGFVLVGARQYGLLILLHDASHGLLHPVRRWNDALTLWLIAAPCGSSYSNSRVTHLMHHRFLGERERDPDYFLYCSGDPQPKQAPRQFVWHFAKLLLGGQIVHTLFGGSNAGGAQQRALQAKIMALVPVAMMQALILGAFALSGHVFAYFYLWVLPLVTLAVLFNGARVFCDHSVPAGASSAAQDILISYISNPVERFFFAPFHMNFHAEHHLFPYVPHYNLPRLREILRQRPEYRERIQWRTSYAGYMLNFLFDRLRSESSFAKP